MDYSVLTDEELLLLHDDEDAETILYYRVKPIMRAAAQPFITRGIDGYDEDDIMQEASLVFTKAMKTYDSSKAAKFRTYLYSCVRSHLLNLVKRSQKNTKTVSLFDPIDSENPEILVIDTLVSEEDSFEEEALREQLYSAVGELAAKVLSDFEYTVFVMFFIEHRTASEIAENLSCSIKSIENTLYRIRTKLKKGLK